ncbi:MAG: RdgB/HAM1 family non-canonical purine NTP pyrophosphatase [Candidatus Cloacimonadales bacterium]
MKLMIASKNKHKLAEIKELLRDQKVEILSALDFPEIPDVVEDKETILGNAIKKAEEIANFTGCLTMADDTGLFVQALQGAPGVYSARYAGEEANSANNRQKLLQALQKVTERSAYFETVIALAQPDNLIGTCNGRVEGEITQQEIGDSGFGYDCIFRAVETGKTFGEMASADKNQISHRARALHNFIPILRSYLEKK